MMETTQEVIGDVPVFDCEQTVRRLWDYLDDELSPLDMAAVDEHLAACERCPPHFAFERRFLHAVREARAAVHTPDAATTATLRQRVVDMLTEAGEWRQPGDSA